MKKHHILLTTLLIGLISTLLVACSTSKSKSVYFQSKTDGVDIRITYYVGSDGSKIVKQKTESIINYKSLNAENKQDAEDKVGYSYKMQKEHENSFKGVKSTLSFKKSYFVKTLTIDYSKANAKQLAQSNIIHKEIYSSKKKEVTLEKVKTYLNSKGFTVIKNGKFK